MTSVAASTTIAIHSADERALQGCQQALGVEFLRPAVSQNLAARALRAFAVAALGPASTAVAGRG